MGEEAREDWLERASRPDLSEEDYKELLEELPSDPEERKEWFDELKIALSLDVLSDERDAQWVRGVLDKVPKRSISVLPLIFKSAAAAAVLIVGLSILHNPKATGVKDDPVSVVRNGSKEGKDAPDDKLHDSELGDGFTAADARDGGKTEGGISFTSPPLGGLFQDSEGALAVVEDRGDPSLQLRQEHIDGASEELAAEGVVGDDLLQPTEGTMIAPPIPSTEVPLERVAGDPFNLEKKRKRRTMVAIASPRPELLEDFGSHASVANTKQHFRSFSKVSEASLSAYFPGIRNDAYGEVRESLIRYQIPSARGIRVEEMINFFSYEEVQPKKEEAFAITSELAISSWNENHHLLKIGIKGRSDPKRQPVNVVFLVDVSTSMAVSDRWGRVLETLESFWGVLNRKDRIGILPFGGQAREILANQSGGDGVSLQAFLEDLPLGGRATQEKGVIEKAFSIAQKSKIAGGLNRVVMITDGSDSSVIADREEVRKLVERQSASGCGLSVISLEKGSSSEEFLRDLSEVGAGKFDATSEPEATRMALARNLGLKTLDLATGAKVEVRFNPDVVASYRLIGFDGKASQSRSGDETMTLTMGYENTTLYEIIPTKTAPIGAEAVSLRMRFKEAHTRKDQLLTHLVSWEENSSKSLNFQWSEVVALWGRKLQKHPSVENFSISYLLDLGEESLGKDPYGYRREMLLLVRAWEEMHKGIDPRKLPQIQIWKEKNPR